MKLDFPFTLNLDRLKGYPYPLFSPMMLLVNIGIWVVYTLLSCYIKAYYLGLPLVNYCRLNSLSIFLDPVIFYFYYFYLFPEFAKRRRLIPFLSISLGILLLVPLLVIFFNRFVQGILFLEEAWGQPLPSYFFNISFFTLIIMVAASNIRFIQDWYHVKRIDRQLHTQHILSELAFLQAQVNPHFLFNTLNTIYTLSYKQDKNTPEAIIRLSELMRYMLYEASNDKVLLEKEITYISNYIDLQRLRLPNPYKVNFVIKGECHGKWIKPMILIPFVENVFKHGISTQGPDEVFLSLKIFENQLHLQTINYLSESQRNQCLFSEDGLGYKNVRKRLNLLYPKRHELAICEKENKYIVNLTVNL